MGQQEWALLSGINNAAELYTVFTPQEHVVNADLPVIYTGSVMSDSTAKS